MNKAIDNKANEDITNVDIIIFINNLLIIKLLKLVCHQRYIIQR